MFKAVCQVSPFFGRLLRVAPKFACTKKTARSTLVSHYTKARAAGYYNGLLTGSEADFLKLVKKYSIHPADDAGSKGTDVASVAAGPTSARPGLQSQAGKFFVRLAQMNPGAKIAYVKLTLAPRGTNTNEGGDTLQVDASAVAAPGYDPVYYLPWDTSGASIRMTIPPQGPANNDPNVFMTAAINGCSIYFQGTRDNPTVYHSGGTTNFAKEQINETVGFWDALMDEFQDYDQTNNINLGALANGSVNKTHYITDPNTQKTATNTFTGTTMHSYSTKRALKLKSKLKTQYAASKLTVREIFPWACVLGRRDGNGDWTFYLQENASIQYSQVERSLPNLFAGKKVLRTVSRPMITWEVFPVGRGHYHSPSGLPSIL